jgi:DNA repair photolyase
LFLLRSKLCGKLARMIDVLPDRARKGRGAVSNRPGRFEPHGRAAVADGWYLEEDLPPLRTTLTPDATRTIIARNRSPDVPFDRSINPYRGCEHGCIYCFARPTHAFLGLSPGLDFETRLFFKPDAARLLDAELRNPKYRCDVVAMGTNTDPYQPVERGLEITRRVLEVLAAFDHPVGIVTKSALVLRDLDILAPMAAKGLAQVCVSVTTLDAGLARRLEPRAATPSRRIATIQALARAGVPTGVMAAPMIPALNDGELEAILERGHEAGASVAGYVLLRVPLEIKDLFREWLETHAPNRAKRVLALLRETHGGQLYESTFGTRMRGTGEYAKLLERRFDVATKRLGLNVRRFELDTSRFRVPPTAGSQLSLF